MAQSQRNGGFWPRMIISLAVIVWVAVLIGNCIGHTILEKHIGNDASSVEVNLPAAERRPWVNKATSMQEEIDQQLGQAASGHAVETVVASPVVSQSGPTGNESSTDTKAQSTSGAVAVAPTPVSGSGEPVPTPALHVGSYVLQFGMFKAPEHAQAVVDRLREKSFTAKSEELASDEGTVYVVRGGEYADIEVAKAKAEELKSSGFDVYVKNN